MCVYICSRQGEDRGGIRGVIIGVNGGGRAGEITVARPWEQHRGINIPSEVSAQYQAKA